MEELRPPETPATAVHAPPPLVPQETPHQMTNVAYAAPNAAPATGGTDVPLQELELQPTPLQQIPAQAPAQALAQAAVPPAQTPLPPAPFAPAPLPPAPALLPPAPAPFPPAPAPFPPAPAPFPPAPVSLPSAQALHPPLPTYLSQSLALPLPVPLHMPAPLQMPLQMPPPRLLPPPLPPPVLLQPPQPVLSRPLPQAPPAQRFPPRPVQNTSARQTAGTASQHVVELAPPGAEQFQDDLNGKLGRANGNVYVRILGAPGAHDGQIMVRLKRKRFIVVDYASAGSRGTAPRCINAPCAKVGVPDLLFDSNPEEPASLYLRSGLCFTCQRNLNEKRRTQRKRKGETAADRGGDAAPAPTGRQGAGRPPKRPRYAEDAIVISGPPEGTKARGREGYDFPEIGEDTVAFVQAGLTEIEHMIATATVEGVDAEGIGAMHEAVEATYGSALHKLRAGLYLITQWKGSWDEQFASLKASAGEAGHLHHQHPGEVGHLHHQHQEVGDGSLLLGDAGGATAADVADLHSPLCMSAMHPTEEVPPLHAAGEHPIEESGHVHPIDDHGMHDHHPIEDHQQYHPNEVQPMGVDAMEEVHQAYLPEHSAEAHPIGEVQDYLPVEEHPMETEFQPMGEVGIQSTEGVETYNPGPESHAAGDQVEVQALHPAEIQALHPAELQTLQSADAQSFQSGDVQDLQPVGGLSFQSAARFPPPEVLSDHMQPLLNAATASAPLHGDSEMNAGGKSEEANTFIV